MKKIIALSLLAASTAAFAQGSGFYVGGSVGQSSTKFKTEDFSISSPFIAESKDRTDTAWKLFGGYNYNQYLGVELGYVDLGKPKYKYAGTNGVVGSGEIKAEESSVFLAAKGTLPINDQFNVFGKLGVTRNHLKSSGGASITSPIVWSVSGSATRNTTEVLYGVGAQYNLTKQIGIRAEYENFGKFGDEQNTGRTKVDMWSAGVSLSF